MSLDERRENACRGACGAATRAARIDHFHARAARCELVGDGAANDTRADDGDVHTAILAGWWLVVGGYYQPPTTNH